MILLLLCLVVPATLFAWKLCAVAGAADDQMEIMSQEMAQEKQSGQIEGDCPSIADSPGKEDADAG